MKHAEKNEFDLLLRGLAKRERASAASPDLKDPATEHLDADELNSYAEDVLPSAARSRYTEHLADCASCRKIVTRLTLSAGAVGQSEVSEKVPGTSFWQKLATLFSPRVLRYAGPAFAVLAVVAISLVVLRQQQQQRSDFIARNEPAATSQPESSPGSGQLEGFVDQPQAGNENRAVQAQPPMVAKQAEQPREKGQSESQAAGSGTTSVKDANTPAKSPSGESQRAYSTEPTAVAPPPPSQPKPAAGAVAGDRPEEKEREQRAKDDASGGKRQDVRGRDGVALSAEERAAARKVQELPSNAGATQGLRKNETASADKKAKASGATRSAGGRQFRREDNAWVDTAYDSSRPLVKVRRGSEQYRALIADEEGLRNIVEALDGTVIVVWKARAYRFQ